MFNTQYNSDPHSLSSTEILEVAFAKGFNAIDTSPYYGPSEEILGEALKKIKGKWARETYMICTKAGRVKLNDFDYSREAVRKSVLRSLQRLDTTYLDLVYMHDIEFVNEQEIFEALRELKLLKEEGLVLNIGVSGYPVDFLYKIALECKQGDIGSLDMIMSYSNGCIQNELMFQYYDDFLTKCGVKKIMNGSILSMSLLRSEPTKDFHPAPRALKDRVTQVATTLKREDGVELADLATRFALRRSLFESKTAKKGEEKKQENGALVWDETCSIVLGVSNVAELEDAISNFELVRSNGPINREDDILFKKVREELGEHFNETWESGIKHN